jgi:tetratricopeptide (TPR) repeat protein
MSRIHSFNAQRSKKPSLVNQVLQSALVFSMALAVPLLAVTSLQAQAQTANPSAPVIRPEVLKLLQASQSAVKESQFEKALSLAQQAMSVPNITKDERPYVLRNLAASALQVKNFELAVNTLESLIQELPDTTASDQKLALIESLLSASQQAKDLDRFVKWARTYLDMGGRNASVRAIYIQTLSVLKRHEEVIKEVKNKIKDDEALKVKTPENELRLMAYSQRLLKDDAAYNASLKLLLQSYPSKAYWAEAIPRVARQANFNVRLELDLYRLLEITGNLEDVTEYTDMASLALKNGLPAEALRVVELAYKESVFGKGSDAANHQKLRQQAQQKLNEDEKAFSALVQSAKDANAISSLADVYASQQKWDMAMTSYNKAIEMGGLRRESEIRLHAGIALSKLGKKAEAEKMWDSVQGEPTAVELAQLWKIWQKAN